VSDFTVYSFDLLTGAALGSTPMRGITFASQVNSPQSGSFTIDMMDPRVLASNPIQNTQPNRTLLVVDYMGSLIWGGIVMTRQPTRSSSLTDTTNTIEVTAVEPWAWFQQRVQATDYSAPPFSGINPGGMAYWTAPVWDAGLIGAQVIVDALGYSQGSVNPFANILGGLYVSYNDAVPSAANPVIPSGDWVNVTFPFSSCQTVDTIFSQVGGQLGLGVGFDYGVDLAYSAGPGSSPYGVVNLNYPWRGRTLAQSNLLVDLTLAREYMFPEDGSQTANQVYEIGGSGAIVVQTNPYPLDQGFPLWERVISRSSAQSQNLMNMLAQLATSDSAMYSYATVSPTIKLGLFDPNIGLTSAGFPFIAGDDVQLFIPALAQDGTVFDERFPAGLDQEWRITGYAVDLQDEGDPTLTLTLAQPPYLAAIASAI
jgi:hypothetical protein